MSEAKSGGVPELVAIESAERELEREAAAVRLDLDLDGHLGALGVIHLVGSAALGLMVSRDLDLTVVCPALHTHDIFQAGAAMATHPRVRQLRFRNDTGHWNTDPKYPDGIYWGVDYRTDAHRWNVDIWFVDDPDRQPDLAHAASIPSRLDDDTRRAILTIKHAWHKRPEYRSSVTSFDIYTAVLDHGVRSPTDFDVYRRRHD